MNKSYCPICGKRMVPLQGQVTYQNEFGTTFTVSAYISDSTELVCFGHPELQSRMPVPRAFYDAFSDDEVQP